MAVRTVDDVLALAIDNEAKSAGFYRQWADAATMPATRKLLESLARDERFHREKLRLVRNGRLPLRSDASMQKLIDLTVSGNGRPVPTRDADYESVLIWAKERERQTYRIYELLLREVLGGEARKVLHALADQEQRHYARLDGELLAARRNRAVIEQFRREA